MERRRRDLLKAVAGGTAFCSAYGLPRLVAHTADGELLESAGEYGGFVVERRSDARGSYEYDPQVLEPMSEKRTVFSRNLWDAARQSRLELGRDMVREWLVEEQGRVPGQSRLDHALYAAAWATAGMDGDVPQYAWTSQTFMVQHLEGLDLGRWDPAEAGMSWDDARRVVKNAALFYGASLAGVAELNPLWLYSDHYSPNEGDEGRAVPVQRDGDRFEQTDDAWYIPESMNRVIALAFEEDYQALATSPGRLASAGSGNGYSRMANTAFFVAEFLRGLGYRALPAGNEVGLSIPMAVDAGLGEVGRMGLLVTPKYGPRVRLAKVITDMPLSTDASIRFGVREFCEVCKLCATHCPGGAVTEGPRGWKGPSVSNNPGTLKWYAEPEKCYDFNGFSCSNCKRVCPFNKPNNSWLHRLSRALIEGKVGALHEAMLELDQASGYGGQRESGDFWASDGSPRITAREKM
jgi:reductive dehalogenase